MKGEREETKRAQSIHALGSEKKGGGSVENRAAVGGTIEQWPEARGGLSVWSTGSGSH